MFTSLLALVLLSPAAYAGPCDSILTQTRTARGAALVKSYQDLATCDVEVARREFSLYLASAGDLETLIPLTIAGIDARAYSGIWDMMPKVPYEHREALASGVGAACVDHANVLPFLQAAWVGLKGTDFTAWEPVVHACPKPEVTTWLEGVVVAPPKSPFNDKYAAMVSAYAKIRGVESLPALEKAAIAAAAEGPFNHLVETIQRSILPKGYKATAPAEHQAAMEQTLVRVAKAVPSEQARLVADRLVNAGNEALAASLLPAIYPDRVASSGQITWAVAAVETCDGQAVVHWAEVTENPQHWGITALATPQIQAVSGKLKCESGVWAVQGGSEPVVSGDGVKAFIDGIVADLKGKGLKVKAVEEQITL